VLLQSFKNNYVVNPLLEPYQLPSYSKILPEFVEPAIDALLSDARTQIANISANITQPIWENTQAVVDEISHKINAAFTPVSHLNAVCNTPELRAAYEACLPKLSDFWQDLSTNHAIFSAFEQLSQHDDLDDVQRIIIERNLRDFRLSGVNLPQHKQQEFKEISSELTRLSSKFSNNVLDATDAWSLHITDENELAGIPALSLQQFKNNAQSKGLAGFLLTLSFPDYYAVITFADNRSLRAKIYKAYVTRASELSDNGKFDNTQVMQRILTLRHHKAQLLGFANYVELSLASKMANNIDEVTGFLYDLAAKCRQNAQNELQEVRDFAAQNYDVTDVQSWDLAYFSEKLREQKYAVNEEQIRQYFPVDHVLEGMFTIANKLYGICFDEVQDFDKPHQDAKLFAIKENNQLLGYFIIDLYARSNKRGGAWMADITNRYLLPSGDLLLPAANLVCNFTPASGDNPALLTHDEVITLFHEFGHSLHHLLTEINYLEASGINGVAWDAVELPSQFFENWCWQEESLQLLTKHYQTGATIPKTLLDNMLGAKNFQAALAMLRQIEFALFDLEIHRAGDKADIYGILQQVRAQIAVIFPPEFNRFAHSFSHIFAGGYAAGYYSYKWAEVLAADAFTRFIAEGIFNAQTGKEFRRAILARGGSAQPMELFMEFMGRKPKIDALLRDAGL